MSIGDVLHFSSEIPETVCDKGFGGCHFWVTIEFQPLANPLRNCLHIASIENDSLHSWGGLQVKQHLQDLMPRSPKQNIEHE